MPTPSVSVLVTAYNHVRFIEECLDSIRSQTLQDFELIIVDNASQDGTADRIQAWLRSTGVRARFERQDEPRGLCATLNRELAMSRAPFVCFVDGDDACEPRHLERLLARFQQMPDEVAAVYGDARMIDAAGGLLHASFTRYHLGDEPLPAGAALFRRLLLYGNFIPSVSVMLRRRALDLVGCYDESLFYEDYQMWLALSHRFRFDHVDGCLARYRVLPTSMSHSPLYSRDMKESDSRILVSWLDRVGDLQQALADRLWQLGSGQIDRGFFPDARCTYAAAATAGPRTGRRVMVRALGWPAAAPALWATRCGWQLVERATTKIGRVARRTATTLLTTAMSS